jgi:hypothetical protein
MVPHVILYFDFNLNIHISETRKHQNPEMKLQKNSFQDQLALTENGL